MGQYVVEMTGWDTSGPGLTTKVFAMGPGLAFSDAAYAPAALDMWYSPTQKIDVSKDGGIDLTGDQGQIVIQNVPSAITGAGPYDALAEWAWYGRRANLYWISDGTWANRQLVDTGILENPVANLSIDTQLTSNLTFTIRDPRQALDVPLQPAKYGGTNSSGMGVDGEADLTGKPLPILYGTASNIPGVRVNASQLIYQLADRSATVLCVRDGGGALTPGVVRANLASLQSNTPTAGHYDTCAISTGTYVKLGSTPIKVISFDVAEGAASANRTHAQIWQRFRQDRCGNVTGDFVAASVTACDTADGNEVGFWWADDSLTQLDCVNELLTSLSGYEVQGFDQKWSITKLVAPSGTTTFDLVAMGMNSWMTTKTRPMSQLARARPNFAPDGAPPYRVNVNWGHNYTVMSDTDFIGAAIQRLRDKFKLEWRTQTATNTAIWDPVALTGPWINAPELTINVAYLPGPDGVTCPAAATEAARLLALYSANKAQYTCAFPPLPGDRILPGAVVSLTYPQHNLGSSPKFLVLQSSLKVQNSQGLISLVVGFRT